MSGNRIFVLGAGFSSGAGLPLGQELWKTIKDRAQVGRDYGGAFKRDLDLYRQYRRECDQQDIPIEDVEFEDFLAFLDLEFRMRLSGSDTWSADGNKTQVLVKQLIAQVLHESMPQIEAVPRHYIEFASLLEPNDYVMTFNYDTLLERLLEAAGRPYRLFPWRYSSVNSHSCTIDSSQRGEVIIYKVHGSIDWFDRSQYLELERMRLADGFDGATRDVLFGPNTNVTTTPIVDGPRPEDDPLRNVFRIVEAPDKFYRSLHGGLTVPCLLTPSHAKALYVGQFAPYWDGMGKAGGWNSALVVVGYSMPKHDEYARQALFRIARNYQDVDWDQPFLSGKRKSPVLLVDLRDSEEDKAAMRRRFGFLDPTKTNFIWTGFGTEAVELIRNGGLVT